MRNLRSVRAHVRSNYPLRVLLFDHVAALSGGEIALLNLVRHLDRSRVEPIVLLGEDGPLVPELAGLCEVHVLPLNPAVASARKDALGASSLLKIHSALSIVGYAARMAGLLSRLQIDIVHSNSLKADIIAGIACRMRRTPLVWHVRDRIASDYLPARVATAFRRLSRHLPDSVIANSRATADTLAWIRPADFESMRASVIHDGVEAARYSISAGARTQSGPVFGLVGRISPWKGQDVFLRAAHTVLASHPAARFRIIGAALFGESAYEASLHRLRAELELEEKVEFTGFCSDVPAAIADLDVLVHASTRAEPFGQVIIEGMAAGKPVIATEGGGAREIIERGRTGLLVPMNDPAAMAEAMNTLLANPALAADLGHRGRESVYRSFSISATANAVLGVYQRLAGFAVTNPVLNAPDPCLISNP